MPNKDIDLDNYKEIPGERPVREEIVVRVIIINPTLKHIKLEREFWGLFGGLRELEHGYYTVRYTIKNASKQKRVTCLVKKHPELKYDVGSCGIREV